MTTVDDQPNGPPPEEAGSSAMARESTSLKRGREGSIDPHHNEAPSTAPVVVKKNRLEEEAAVHDVTEADEDAPSSLNPNAEAAVEGQTVGEVRRKVEKMNWKEGEPRVDDVPGTEDLDNVSMKHEEGKTKDIQAVAVEGQDNEDKVNVQPVETDQVEDRQSVDATSVKEQDEVEVTDGTKGNEGADHILDDVDSDSLKRKGLDRASSSFLKDSEKDAKRHKSASPPLEESQTSLPPTTSEPVKKPQATFGAFSSSASPFASAVKAPGVLDAPTKNSISPFTSSGFGNYSNAFSPFAKKSVLEGEAADQPGPSSFGDILKEKGDGDGAEGKRLQLDKQDVPTGEEDEETVYQTRVKLYAMEEHGGWKERGVGSLKLNVRREDGSGARLVMRAEGVLRVILNASLYVGMTCLEDGKHVRTTVFEGKDRQFITFRTGNPKIAAELCAAIQEHTPLESPRASRSPQSEA